MIFFYIPGIFIVITILIAISPFVVVANWLAQHLILVSIVFWGIVLFFTSLFYDKTRKSLIMAFSQVFLFLPAWLTTILGLQETNRSFTDLLLFVLLGVFEIGVLSLPALLLILWEDGTESDKIHHGPGFVVLNLVVSLIITLWICSL